MLDHFHHTWRRIQKCRMLNSAIFCFGVGLVLNLFSTASSLQDSISNSTQPKLFNYEELFWQKEIIYQIYPRSFYDSDGDGVGDLTGIQSKAGYLKELGVGIVWISPVYESPMKDFGYDISNYTNIDPIFGTLEDFDALVKEYHAKDIKIVMDYVPNHTSDKHEWFLRSIEKDPLYEDFYIWKDPLSYNETGQPIPPNNWLSAFRFSAWEWNAKRKQFYYHKYLVEQPDLNYRNPNVVEVMKENLRFWMDKGVDGFRLDAVNGLVEVEDVVGNDEPVAENSNVTDPTQFEYLNHTLTQNLPEMFEIIRGWKEVLDTYENKFLMAEVYNENIEITMEYYGNVSDFPFNFYFIMKLNSRDDITGTNLRALVDLWLNNMPAGSWPNWVLGSHDNGRVGSRLGEDLIDSLNMLTLLLPGTPVTYYGEEIGMMNDNITFEEAKDPYGCTFGPKRFTEFGRDPERTPMQWDDSEHAGFTEGNSTWLPINDNYKQINVKAQQDAKQSSWRLYSYLAVLRQRPVFRMGAIKFLLSSLDTLAFARYMENSISYVIIINTAKEDRTVNLMESEDSQALPQDAILVLRSSSDHSLETTVGTHIPLSSIPMKRGEGMVLMVPSSMF